MYQKITVLFLLLLSLNVQGQEEDLFRSIKAETQIDESLLPDRMVFTQSLLWGERGLMRKTGWSPLTIEQREKELKIRRKMLKTPSTHRLCYTSRDGNSGNIGDQIVRRKI